MIKAKEPTKKDEKNLCIEKTLDLSQVPNMTIID